MKIVIAGSGKVGRTVAAVLSEEGNDVTVIDHDSDTIASISNALDVICVEGNAADPETLRNADADKADLLIAATEKDEVNMVCGIVANKLGAKHVIARIRDTQYLHQAQFLREALGLSQIINPEYECAKEISRILRFPGAARVDSFSKGSVEIVEHRIPENGALNNLMLKELISRFNAKVLIALLERNGEALIPNGSTVMKTGDRLSITGSSKELRRFFVAIGEYRKPVRHVMIMGGGRTSVYLARILQENGIEVTIVERDREKCNELCDKLPRTHIVCGDATHHDVLLEDGIKSVEGFVSLTGEDGDTIITSLYARICQVDKVITKVNHDHFAEILNGSGLDSIVSPKEIVAQQLARYVRALSNSEGSSMETLYKLADGKVEVLEFVVGKEALCVNIPLKRMRLRENILISAVIRENETILPDGNTALLPGDHAIIVANAGHLRSLNEILEGKS